VHAHEFLECLLVAGLQRFHHFVVFDHDALDTLLHGGKAEDDRKLARQRLEGANQRLIIGQAAEAQVELGVEAGDAKTVVGVAGFVHGGQHLLQRRQHARIALEPLDHLGAGQQFEREPHLEDLLQPLDVDAHQAHAAIALGHHDALAFEQPQRLAYRYPADVERARHLGFHDAVAGQENAGRSSLDNRVDHLVDKASRSERAQPGDASVQGSALLAWHRQGYP
jgi:hypothetical protein